MMSFIGVLMIVIYSIVLSMFVTGVPFIIPVLKYVNSYSLNPLSYLWVIPFWFLGMGLLIYVPILYFIIAIPIVLLGFVYSTSEWFIALIIGAIILGIGTLANGGL